MNKIQNQVKNNNNDQKSEIADKLRLFIQINTSGEESKSGFSADASKFDEVFKLIEQIEKDENSEKLIFEGLMTIGRPVDEEKNHLKDFDCLNDLKTKILEKKPEKLLNNNQVKLSMGMSSDFEDAIKHGSDYVRVGSKIFGARDYSNKK